MREILKLVGVLTLICVVCSALLAAVYDKTKGPIEKAAEARKVEAARKVLPAEAPEPRRIERDDTVNFVVTDAQDRLVAMAVEGRSPRGYGGDVVLMVGIAADGRVLDFEVLSASETPGLGNKIASEVFKKGIRGRPLRSDWRVLQDGGEIDAITAATISSRAALEAVRDAIARYRTLAVEFDGGRNKTPGSVP